MEKNNQFLELGQLINAHLKSRKLAIVDIINNGNHYAFGQINQGLYRETKPIHADSSQSFYQDVYDWVSTEYTDKIIYGYSHSCLEGYTYHFEIGKNFILRLLGESHEDNNWIYNRVQNDAQLKQAKNKKM